LQDEIQPISWASDRLRLLDQTRLPQEEVVVESSDYRQVIAFIREMRVRGAPAIGVTGAYAMVLAAKEILESGGGGEFLPRLRDAAEEIKAARPTAINLAWAVKRLMEVAKAEAAEPAAACERLLKEAKEIQRRDVEANRQIGRHGAPLLSGRQGVLTHCNTGALATAGYGTALGVIRAAWEQGDRFKVFHTETRPFLQGARLTAWELVKLGIPATMVVDSAAGLILRQGEVGCVVVGADRIAANGDTANKIGTYGIAVLARENGAPFYVAAPTTTVDLSVASGGEIPIEERDAAEVSEFGGVRTAAEGIGIRNPAFDVTPHEYVDAIITEVGVIRPPYEANLRAAVARAQEALDG
jgi:methylthioribose-1-phosphate isomerase